MTRINPNYSNSQLALDASNTIALQVEPLEKAAKIGHKSIEYAATFGPISEAFTELCSHLKGAVALFETVQFIGRIKELVSLDEKGRSFFSVNTWQKCTDRVTLAIHSSMKAIRTLAKCGIVKLGRLGANIAGKLTIFSFVTDLFILASSTFSIWDNVLKGIKVRKELSQANYKIEKWEYRKTLIAQVESGVQSEIKFLQAKYERKVAAISADKAAELEQSLLKYNHRLNLIKNNDHLELANELLTTDLSYKEKKWSVIKHNASIAQTKVRLGILNSSFKIGVVTLALGLSALNYWANAALRPLLLGGIATDSIGISKFFYDKYNKPLALPAHPGSVTALAAAAA